ncbi:MAG: CsgG/HfaB family protein [Pseudomonadota bacterium]
MKLSIIFLSLFTIIFCTSASINAEQQNTTLLFIDATVRSVAGTEIIIEVKPPILSTTSESYITDIAKQAAHKSLFIEGIKTEMNGIPAIVKEVRNTIVTLDFEKDPKISVGTTVKMLVPKKTLAVLDFEVIRGKEKDIGRATLEGLTSALIDSGSFSIVERSKLKTVLDEQTLSLTGATKTSEKLVGQLLTADLILTGTLADVGGNKWDINLRLVNVRTGQALGAIVARTSLFKPQELRDSNPVVGDFEKDSEIPSWLIGYRKKGKYNVSLDTLQGAEGTKHSLKMEFDFSALKKKITLFASIANQKKRDISLFNGIEFFIKADQSLTGSFALWTSMPDDPNRIDNWTSRFDISRDWKRVRVPFDNLTIGRHWIKMGADQFGAKPGDQILRLDRVESILIGVSSGFNPPVTGEVWLDKIRFYTD